MKVNVQEAKANLSELLKRVALGEEVVITKEGKPIAKHVAIPSATQRKLGSAKGEFVVPDDFNDPLPKEIE